MSIRLPASKRNAIIADFTNGVNDPEYEVIPSKTIKGKYTVRKRKAEESGDQQAEEPQHEVALQELPPITSYYQNDYPQPQTNYQPPPRPLTPAPEPVQYQNDYEAKLDDMAGTYNFVSRRDRLKAFI